MKSNYSKAYVEVLEILKYLPDEEVQKIPEEKIKFLKENCDKEYDFVFDSSKTVDEQKLLRETNAVMVILFRDYFATDVQKEKIKKILLQNSEKHQTELRKKYNPDDLFKKHNKENIVEEKCVENEAAMVVYKENVWKKIVNKIKRILRII